MTRTDAQKTAMSKVDSLSQDLSIWCSTIFNFAEPAWREYQSSTWYVERLRAEGFTVEQGSGGMPTAFAADWSNGNGPSIGMYAEYDAVPGNCQAASTCRQPREGLDFHAAGHTDPHSGLGIGALGGVLATKAAMQAHGIQGNLRFMGEPAEKTRGSKPIHAAQGYYDDLSAMLSFHPFYMMPLCNSVRWDTHCGAAYSMIFRFICDAPEAWGKSGGPPIPQSHSAIRAPGANEALMIMYQASKTLRDSMLPHSGGWSISEAILSTGQATADNLPAQLSDLQYMIRVPSVEMAKQVTAALERNAEAAATMTGCRWEKHWVCKSRPGLANHTMSNIVWSAMQTVGPPIWGDKAVEVAQNIQRTLNISPMSAPFLDACSQLCPPLDAEAILRKELPPSQMNSTSDDYTEMTWHTPTARFYVARPTLKTVKDRPYPAWVMNALGGIPATIDPMVCTAAKILAVAAVRLLEDKSARESAMAEFKKRTGGGIGGRTWMAPLCDYAPPIEFKWPEYVNTPRGRKIC